MKIIAALTVLMAAFVSLLPVVTSAAENDSLEPILAGREGWLNGSLNAQGLAGKVVVVDVFTFGCGNCQNVVPNLRTLAANPSAGVVVVGVHSPETAYEHVRSHVIENLRAQGIAWPVALDNSFAIWNAYGVEAWPTQLIFDRHGKLRKTIVGDSQDRIVDSTVTTLLGEK